MVIGLFEDHASAERAFIAVTRRGYDKSDINIVMDDDTRTRWFPANPGNASGLAEKAAEHGELGGPLGGTLGTIFTAVAAVGTFLLLPVAGIVAAGPVAAALAGAGTAAVAGGLAAALHDWEIPQDRIDAYEGAIKAGGILMGVKPRTPEDAREIEREWQAMDAARVQV